MLRCGLIALIALGSLWSARGGPPSGLDRLDQYHWQQLEAKRSEPDALLRFARHASQSASLSAMREALGIRAETDPTYLPVLAAMEAVSGNTEASEALLDEAAGHSVDEGNFLQHLRFLLAVEAADSGRVISEAMTLLPELSPEEALWSEVWLAAMGAIPPGAMDDQSTSLLQFASDNAHAPPAVRSLAAREWATRNHPEAALALWQPLLDSSDAGQRFQASLAAAELLGLGEQRDESITLLLETARQTAPRDVRRNQLYELARATAETEEQRDLLVTGLQEILSEQPSDAAAWLAVSELLTDEQARLKHLELAAAAQPDHSPIQAAYRDALDQAGQPDEALAVSSRLLRLFPDVWEMEARHVDLLIQLGQLEEAETHLKARASTLLPGSPAHQVVLGFVRDRHLDELLGDLLTTMPPDSTRALELAALQLKLTQSQEAEATLLAYFESLPSPQGKSDFAIQAVELLKSKGDLEASLTWIDLAIDTRPNHNEALLIKADLLAAGDPESAASWLAGALGESDTELPAEELDRRLFDLLVALDSKPSQPSAADSLALAGLLPKRSNDSGPRVLAQIDSMQEARSPEGYARLARWQRWSRQAGAADATLRLALAEHPDSLPLLEAAAETASASGDHARAAMLLRQLADLDAENRDDHLRRVAAAELDRNDTDAALAILQQLAEAQPDSVQVWRELAVTQQQADSWFESIESWKKAFQLADQEERLELLRPMISVYERLQQHQSALKLFKESLLSLVDLQLVGALARDAATYAEKHEQEPAWNEVLEELARHFQRLNRPDLIAATRQSPPDSDPTTNAADSGGSRAKSTRLSTPAGEEDVTDWELKIRQFPRNRTTLMAAANHFETAQDLRRAAELMARANELEPLEFEPGMRLADWWTQLGERSKALDLLAELLERKQEIVADEPRYPAAFSTPDQLQQDAIRLVYRLRAESGGWSRARAGILSTLSSRARSMGPDSRQEVIEKISQLVRGTDAEERWAARWQNLKNPGERVTGLHHLGRDEEALKTLRQQMENDPTDYQAVLAFFELAAAGNRWKESLDLLRPGGDDFPEKLDIFLSSLSRAAANSGGLDQESLLVEFQKHDPVTEALAWPAAQVLAGNGAYPAAVQLGESALLRMSGKQRARAVLDVTDWALRIYDLPAVKRLVNLPLDPPDGSFDDPALAVCRVRWLLASTAEKDVLYHELTSSLEGDPEAPAVLARLALYEGLEGQTGSAIELNSRLLGSLASRGFFGPNGPGLGAWAATGAIQLAEWQLPQEATALLETALEADPALLTLRRQSDAYERESLRLRLLTSRFRHLSPGEAPGFFEEVLQSTSLESGAQLAGLLEQDGNQTAALQLYLGLIESHGPEIGLLIPAYRCATQVRDAQSAWQLGSIILAQGIQAESLPANKDLLLQMAHIAFRSRELELAEGLIDQALQADPADSRLLDWKARLARWRGDTPEAIAWQKKQFDNSPVGEGGTFLITWQLQSGQLEEAIQTFSQLSKRNPGMVPAALRTLLSQLKGTPEQEAGLTAALEAVRAHAPESAPALADYLVKAEQTEALNNVTALVEQMNPPRPDLLFGVWQARALQDPEFEDELKKLVEQAPSLRDRYLTFRQEAALRNGQQVTLESELLQEWQEGKGDPKSGTLLLQLYAPDKEKADLEPLLDTLLAQSSPDVELEGVAKWLDQNGHARLAAKVRHHLVELQPWDLTHRLRLAQTEWQAGNKTEAMRTLEPALKARKLMPGMSRTLGDWFLTNHRPARAAQLYLESTAENQAIGRRQDLIAAGGAFLSAGLPMEATEALLLALDIPGDAFPSTELAKLHAALPGDLLPAWEDALETLPTWAQEEISIARIQLWQGDQAWENILTHFEAHPRLPAILASGRVLNEAALASGQADRASRIWNQTLALFPYPETRRLAAQLPAAQAKNLPNSSPERRRALRQAIEWDPSNIIRLTEFAAETEDNEQTREFLRTQLARLLKEEILPSDRQQATLWLRRLGS